MKIAEIIESLSGAEEFHTKLISQVVDSTSFESIFAIADVSLSEEMFYENDRWDFIETLDPGVVYLRSTRRATEQEYSDQWFQTPSKNLEYEEGLTIPELLDLNKNHKVYDYGKRKYLLK